MNERLGHEGPALRVSPLRALLGRHGVGRVVVDGVEVSGVDGGRQALADLSTCDRIGLKGRAAEAWLGSVGVSVPPKPQRLVEQPDGLLVARLSDTEFVLADYGGPTSAAVAAVREAHEAARPDGCYDVPRAESQAAFGLAGETVAEVLGAVCPADLRAHAFGPGDVVQSLCAGVAAQVWNLSRGRLDRAVVTCDASVALHLWTALHEAVVAAGGRTGAQAAWFESAPPPGHAPRSR